MILRFSPETVKAIVKSLPKPRSKRHLELLSEILREWSDNDLTRHLSMESRATIIERDKKLERVRKCAFELSIALDLIDTCGHRIIVAEMLRLDGRSIENLNETEWPRLRQRLRDEMTFLAKLAAITPQERQRFRRGRPLNIIAYLVLLDAAAIFEWFSGKKAARGVNRIDGSETGPFFRFVSVLWPIIFGKGDEGLPAAIKNWASWRSKFDEHSAFIANVDLSHPTWGIFDANSA